MQVSTRLSYPDPGAARQRARSFAFASSSRLEERAGGYRGTLARSPHQAVNDRLPGGSADKEVFVARSLSSTLAMIQMHVPPDAVPRNESPAASPQPAVGDGSVLQDLFSAVFASSAAQ